MFFYSQRVLLAGGRGWHRHLWCDQEVQSRAASSRAASASKLGDAQAKSSDRWGPIVLWSLAYFSSAWPRFNDFLHLFEYGSRMSAMKHVFHAQDTCMHACHAYISFHAALWWCQKNAPVHAWSCPHDCAELQLLPINPIIKDFDRASLVWYPRSQLLQVEHDRDFVFSSGQQLDADLSAHRYICSM